MKHRHVEDDIQSRFFNVIGIASNRYPILKWIYAIPNGGTRNLREAVRLKRQGVTPGVADVFVPIAGKNGYHGLYIEFKTPENVQSNLQHAFEMAMMERGYLYRLCHSTEDAIFEIEDYTGLRILENPRPKKS